MKDATDKSKIYATVDDVIEILKKVSDKGKGDYLVGCNSEYWLARKYDYPEIDDVKKEIDLGGYT